MPASAHGHIPTLNQPTAPDQGEGEAVTGNSTGALVKELDPYLDTLYGRKEGYAIMAVGTGPYRDSNDRYKHTTWRETAYEWPAHRDQLLAAIRKVVATADVYLCPELMQTKERRKGNEVSRRRLHADVDIDIDTDKVRKIGGYAVGSGTGGHGHVYVELAESVNEREYTALARLLGLYLGAQDSKIAANDVLRPPGTLNHKATVTAPRGPATPVRWLVGLTLRRVWTAADLFAFLKTALPTAASSASNTVTAAPVDADIDLDNLPPRGPRGAGQPGGDERRRH